MCCPLHRRCWVRRGACGGYRRSGGGECSCWCAHAASYRLRHSARRLSFPSFPCRHRAVEPTESAGCRPSPPYPPAHVRRSSDSSLWSMGSADEVAWYCSPCAGQGTAWLRVSKRQFRPFDKHNHSQCYVCSPSCSTSFVASFVCPCSWWCPWRQGVLARVQFVQRGRRRARARQGRRRDD